MSTQDRGETKEIKETKEERTVVFFNDGIPGLVTEAYNDNQVGLSRIRVSVVDAKIRPLIDLLEDSLKDMATGLVIWDVNWRWMYMPTEVINPETGDWEGSAVLDNSATLYDLNCFPETEPYGPIYFMISKNDPNKTNRYQNMNIQPLPPREGREEKNDSKGGNKNLKLRL